MLVVAWRVNRSFLDLVIRSLEGGREEKGVNGREEIAAAFKCLTLEEQAKRIGVLYLACEVLEVKVQRLREREAWLMAEQERKKA